MDLTMVHAQPDVEVQQLRLHMAGLLSDVLIMISFKVPRRSLKVSSGCASRQIIRCPAIVRGRCIWSEAFGPSVHHGLSIVTEKKVIPENIDIDINLHCTTFCTRDATFT